MSGRDFKSFVASHQAEIGKNDTRLVTRFLAGHKPTYKPVDYDQLYALTKIKQSSGDRALRKIEKLSQQNKDYKERQLIQEHKRVWEKEIHKLKKAQEQLENDIKFIRPSTPDFEHSVTSLEELYEDVLDYEDDLQHERQIFIKNTLQPVLDLHTDVEDWLKENRNQLVLGVHDAENENNIREIIQSVKSQQCLVIEKLEGDEEIIEDELYSIIENIGIHVLELKLSKIKLGIPEHILQLKCPDESLQESCLQEFDALDQKYSGYMELLEEKYEHAIERSPNGGWNELDHARFKSIINQYKEVTKNRRKLYMDRLKIELPYKTREQLSFHEDWWFHYKSFQAQLKDLFHAWKRDKDDLALHVQSLFHDACCEYVDKTQNMVEHMKQKFVCNLLHEKLFEYQTERLELMKLEAAHRASQEEEERRQRKLKESREKERREKDKQKVKSHKQHHERLSAKLRSIDKKRMLELREKQAVQRRHDLERVQYRQDRLSEKIEQEKQHQLQKGQEAIEREKRLQVLREQVVVDVKDDPTRLYEPTQASKARVAVVEHEEKESQAPLFNIYTYSVEQVANDNRLKVENALRRANLHMTEYAQRILKNIEPPTKPRKDTRSTAFE